MTYVKLLLLYSNTWNHSKLVSKLATLVTGEGSLFNSYYTKV